MQSNIITLLTDFGSKDNYLAIMKAVILTINPNVVFVDITNEIPPQNLWEATFQLGTAASYFPDNTIHLAIVDPEVGTSRKPLLLQTPHGTFIGPDNGIFTLTLKKDYLYSPEAPASNPACEMLVPDECQAYHLTNPKFWRHPISDTFHGRDIFGPVAAHVSTGVPIEELGVEVKRVKSMVLPNLIRTDNKIEGKVIHTDQFGNLITNIPKEALTGHNVTIKIGGHSISNVDNTYAGGKGAQALIGSYGLLEIAINLDNAEQVLGLSINTPVEINIKY
ncbi:SAM-dependent chlorinase/fluorinase [SAR202 cluster bacterium AD-802-E10_MRT_200m]|nr:SAM-dependent chlorinase/fluorinase [SAR202 cluster bacterium AD-802-E10_MRT_200m]